MSESPAAIFALSLRHIPDFNTMDLHLQNRRALVTGSTKGIGHAIAVALAAEGARVILNGRTDASVADAVARLLAEVPDAHVEAFAGDLADPAQAAALVARVPAVDILVNNLGIFDPKPFEAIDDAEWLRFFNVNVMSGVRLARAYLPGMRAQNWGRVIFISSESGVQIPAEMIHYGVTKTALLGLSRGLAELCAGTAVTVNACCPARRTPRGWTNSSASSPAGSASRRSRRPSSRPRGRPRSSSALPHRRRWPAWSPTSPARCRRPPRGRRCGWMAGW